MSSTTTSTTTPQQPSTSDPKPPPKLSNGIVLGPDGKPCVSSPLHSSPLLTNTPQLPHLHRRLLPLLPLQIHLHHQETLPSRPPPSHRLPPRHHRSRPLNLDPPPLHHRLLPRFPLPHPPARDLNLHAHLREAVPLLALRGGFPVLDEAGGERAEGELERGVRALDVRGA